MKFMAMVWAAFLARQNPVSTSANPACMNMTRKPVRSVQTMLTAILLWPTAAITSAMAGALASFTGTSAAVPVLSPVGSGTGAAGAAATGAAAGGGGGAWAWGTKRQGVTPAISTAPVPKTTDQTRF